MLIAVLIRLHSYARNLKLGQRNAFEGPGHLSCSGRAVERIVQSISTATSTLVGAQEISEPRSCRQLHRDSFNC
jgi:hypothetical protein